MVDLVKSFTSLTDKVTGGGSESGGGTNQMSDHKIEHVKEDISKLYKKAEVMETQGKEIRRIVKQNKNDNDKKFTDLEREMHSARDDACTKLQDTRHTLTKNLDDAVQNFTTNLNRQEAETKESINSHFRDLSEKIKSETGDLASRMDDSDAEHKKHEMKMDEKLKTAVTDLNTRITNDVETLNRTVNGKMSSITTKCNGDLAKLQKIVEQNKDAHATEINGAKKELRHHFDSKLKQKSDSIDDIKSTVNKLDHDAKNLTNKVQNDIANITAIMKHEEANRNHSLEQSIAENARKINDLQELLMEVISAETLSTQRKIDVLQEKLASQCKMLGEKVKHEIDDLQHQKNAEISDLKTQIKQNFDALTNKIIRDDAELASQNQRNKDELKKLVSDHKQQMDGKISDLEKHWKTQVLDLSNETMNNKKSILRTIDNDVKELKAFTLSEISGLKCQMEVNLGSEAMERQIQIDELTQVTDQAKIRQSQEIDRVEKNFETQLAAQNDQFEAKICAVKADLAKETTRLDTRIDTAETQTAKKLQKYSEDLNARIDNENTLTTVKIDSAQEVQDQEIRNIGTLVKDEIKKINNKTSENTRTMERLSDSLTENTTDLRYAINCLREELAARSQKIFEISAQLRDQRHPATSDQYMRRRFELPNVHTITEFQISAASETTETAINS